MKLEPKESYYALICSDAKYAGKRNASLLVCGVYASRPEAVVVAKEIDGCPLPHTIKKVRITVEWV